MERREQRQGPRREAARHRKPMSGSPMFTTLLTIGFVFIAVIVIVVCIRRSESLIFSSKQSPNQPDSKPEYDTQDSPQCTVIANYYSILLHSECFTSSSTTSSLFTVGLRILLCRRKEPVIWQTLISGIYLYTQCNFLQFE